MSLKSKPAKLLSSDEAAVMIEYALLLLFIATVLIGLTALIGNITLNLFAIENTM